MLVKRLNPLIWLIFLSIFLIRGVLKPFWFSIPRIGSITDWKILYYAAILYPVIFAGILSFFLINKPTVRLILRTSLIIVFSFFVLTGYFSLRLYSVWRDSPVGKYLLWPHSNYYFEIIYSFSLPYIINLISGLITLFVFWLIYWLTNKRTLDKSEIFISLLLGLIFGVKNLYIILGAFFLGVLWYVVKIRSIDRIRLYNFLILVGLLGLLIF